MNLKTRHKLVDLRSEVNKEREQKIIEVKQNYLETVSKARQTTKTVIADIKTAYRKIYADRKTELIAENEV